MGNARDTTQLAMSKTTWRTMKLTELNPAEYNPREITDDALIGLENSLEEFGLVQNLVWNRQTGNLVGGHQRMKVMVGQGLTEGMVCVVDMTLRREKALNVALNNPHIAGTFDGGLQSLLEEIRDDDAHLFRDVYLDKLLKEEVAVPPPEDVAPEPPKNPITKPGDIWTMGDHSIICGDCRNIDDVKKLLGDSKINVAFTSPPYASQRKYDESSGFRPIRPDDYVEWFCDVQANVEKFLAGDGSWFVNIKEHCDGGQRHLYVKDLTLAHVREWGWMFVDEFCWRDTKNGVPGGWTNRFKDAWEPVFHFAHTTKIKFNALANATKTNAAFDYSSGNATSGSGSGLLGEKASGVREGLARPSNVVEIPAGSTGKHSAEFPVALPSFFIHAFSDEGDIIFDPFMGSGTTMIAAQHTSRKSVGCEISPAYCDVIVERWEQLTGGKASRK